MNLTRSAWLAGMILVAALALSIGHRPTLQAQQPPALVEPKPNSDGFEGGSYEHLQSPPVVHLPARPMTLEATRVYLKLQERIPMEFPKDTSFGDVLKYIRTSTVDKSTLPEGIAVYVDPAGLNDADMDMGSMVQFDMKGIPLATTLKLLLAQLSLTYELRPEGFLYVTSIASENIHLHLDTDSLILDNLSALRGEVMRLRTEIRDTRGGSPQDLHPMGRQGSKSMNGNVGGGFR
jgi:hypothetical protein